MLLRFAIDDHCVIGDGSIASIKPGGHLCDLGLNSVARRFKNLNLSGKILVNPLPFANASTTVDLDCLQDVFAQAYAIDGGTYTGGSDPDIRVYNTTSCPGLVITPTISSGQITQVANTMAFTISQPGIYRVDLTTNMNTSDDNFHVDIMIYKNGLSTGFFASSTKMNGRTNNVTCTGVLPLLASDEVQFYIKGFNKTGETCVFTGSSMVLQRLRTSSLP